ncbi:MAG: DUF4168 domain-containing protein [Balneolaceae bacterium]
MKTIQSMFAGLFALLLMATAVSAQQMQPQQQPQQPQAPAPDEISDDELLTFVATSDAIRPIQEEAQMDMRGVIEEEGISIQRFQQLMMAMQNPQMADQVEMSAEEEQSIQEMEPKLVEIETAASEEITSEIANQGLDVDRYQAIYMSLQQHPELMERLQAMMEDE